MARTDNLSNFLTDVANAIREKKGTTDTIQASNFDTEIASIEGGSSKYAPRYICFYAYTGTDLTEEVANLDTSKVTIMKQMFYNCTMVKSLDLSNFNTSNVTSMWSTFYGCALLTSLNLSSFDTSKVTIMKQMFDACKKLTELNLSNFNTSNVTNMSAMFRDCTALTSLDIRNFDFAKVTTYDSMFSNVKTNCLIIVKDETAKTWITSKFTTLTNVKTVAELEGTE